MNNGWIKLHRTICEWEWIDDHPVVILWLHCLILANHEERTWRGNVVKPGQFISSIQQLSMKSKLTNKQVRLAILKLKRTGEMASQSTSDFTLFTLNSWEKYQSTETEGKQEGEQKASEGQAKGKRRATNKNEKNEENEKKVEFTPPTEEEVEAFINENKYPVSPVKWHSHYTANGWVVGKRQTPMLDWKAAVRTWLPDGWKKPKVQANPTTRTTLVPLPQIEGVF